jgi:hypothetical protein
MGEPAGEEAERRRADHPAAQVADRHPHLVQVGLQTGHGPFLHVVFKIAARPGGWVGQEVIHRRPMGLPGGVMTERVDDRGSFPTAPSRFGYLSWLAICRGAA